MLVNFKQAEKLMRDGHKVTNIKWLDGDFIEMIGDAEQLVDDSGNAVATLTQIQSLPTEGWFNVSDTSRYKIRLEDIYMTTYKHLDYPQLLDRAILELQERRDELEVKSIIKNH